MDRRTFLASSLAVTASSALPLPSAEQAPIEALNPPAIRVAGIRMLPVVGGKYKVWTKRIGSGPLKVLTLHGGPGFSHDYLEAMESFLPQAGMELYYYDQLGCGNSDRPDDDSLWTIPRYLDEVEEVRRGLGLENFVLLGHSWGGMLAMEYGIRYSDKLRGLVISNMTAGMKAYLKRTAWLKQTLMDQPTRTKFEAMEAKGDYDNSEYQRIVMEILYPQMLCRIKPWPEPVTRAFRVSNEHIYNFMQGKSEFEVTGNLKTWEAWDRLHLIRTKTLTIGATYDEMNPEDMKKIAEFIPGAKNFTCPKGSHLAMWDDQENYFNGLLGFLKTV